MKAEIITIGDELLIGQTVDTNSAYMASELALLGANVVQITTISDEHDKILEALTNAEERAELILITGGLGPTKDDITKKTLCEYFDTELELHEDILEEIRQRFAEFGREMLPTNVAQAELPKACTVIRNYQGTASGMWFERDGKVFVSMPGVPYEMKGLMENGVLQKISEHFHVRNIVHHTVHVQGIGESFLADQLEDWTDSLDEAGIKLAYLPSPGIVKLRLTYLSDDKDEGLALIKKKAEELNNYFPKHIFGVNGAQIEEVVGKVLLEKGATVSTAESCTGGYIAHLITSVSGSSGYFSGSVVAYTEQVKEEQLGVNPDDIKKHTVVSQEVVEQMAEGVRSRFGTTYGIATTGVAGPNSDDYGTPVGTVWIAIAGPDRTISKEFKFGRHRSRTIRKAALTALNLLRVQATQ